MFQVVKRDGEIAEFQMAKITSAIDKAFDAKEKNYSKDMIDLLALRVTADFQNKIQDGKVTVEDIQDSVENVLIQAGYSDVAKAYILYRKQREKIRNMKSTILDYKEIVDSYVKVEDWRVKENSTVTYSVGVNNSIFDVELNSLLTLYKTLVTEINTLEKEINLLIEEVHPHYLSVPGIGSISAAIIYSEYGDISNFDNPGQMLAFAGIEPGINESGTESHGGRMVKRGSSQLRYALINCCLPLIRFDMTFATYYAKKRAEGKPHRVAITHVAKKLIRVIYALERQNTDFCVQKLR